MGKLTKKMVIDALEERIEQAEGEVVVKEVTVSVLREKLTDLKKPGFRNQAELKAIYKYSKEI